LETLNRHGLLYSFTVRKLNLNCVSKATFVSAEAPCRCSCVAPPTFL
jgi:hypothetical protein